MVDELGGGGLAMGLQKGKQFAGGATKRPPGAGAGIQIGRGKMEKRAIKVDAGNKGLGRGDAGFKRGEGDEVLPRRALDGKHEVNARRDGG